MADINIERKKRSAWPWLLTVLLVAAIAIAAWAYLRSQNRAGVSDVPPAAEMPGSPTNGEMPRTGETGPVPPPTGN